MAEETGGPPDKKKSLFHMTDVRMCWNSVARVHPNINIDTDSIGTRVEPYHDYQIQRAALIFHIIMGNFVQFWQYFKISSLKQLTRNYSPIMVN